MKCKCQKCNHEWIARIEDKPRQCPRCKSYNWEEETTKCMNSCGREDGM